MAASRDSAVLCTLTPTRGCRMPYPLTTIFFSGSITAWFNGCARAPIIRCAVPRGSSVSASRVITNRTCVSMERSPTFTGKLSYFPRSSLLKSSSFRACAPNPSKLFRAGCKRGDDGTGRTIPSPVRHISHSVRESNRHIDRLAGCLLEQAHANQANPSGARNEYLDRGSRESVPPDPQL